MSGKAFSSTVAMVIVFAISTYLASRGVMLPPGLQEAVTGVVAAGVAYLVAALTPASRSEIIASPHLDNEVVAAAQADPNSPVDIAKLVDDEVIVRAQLDPEAPATMPEGETPRTLEKKLNEIVAEKNEISGDAAIGELGS